MAKTVATILNAVASGDLVLKADVDGLVEALNKMDVGQSQRPDHWDYRVMARSTARAALTSGPGARGRGGEETHPRRGGRRPGGDAAMSEFEEPVFIASRGKKKPFRVRPWVVFVTPLAAILFQVYVPLYLPLLRYLELTLLVTVYLAVSRRGPVAGAVTGALIGLLQDSLSSQPLGVFGMVKTVIGYAAASLGVRLDTGHAAVRFGLGCFFFAAHQLLYEAAARWLLGRPAGLSLLPTLAATAANGAAGVLLFYLLDKLRDKEG